MNQVKFFQLRRGNWRFERHFDIEPEISHQNNDLIGKTFCMHGEELNKLSMDISYFSSTLLIIFTVFKNYKASVTFEN